MALWTPPGIRGNANNLPSVVPGTFESSLNTYSVYSDVASVTGENPNDVRLGVSPLAADPSDPNQIDGATVTNLRPSAGDFNYAAIARSPNFTVFNGAMNVAAAGVILAGTFMLGGVPAAGEAGFAAEGELLAGARLNVNPLGGTMNCVNCAVATDATLSGSPASALLSGPQPISVLGSGWAPVSGEMEIGSILSQSGNGAQGIVFGESATGEVGHVWNAINNNGTINFIDGQIGGSGLGNFSSFQNFQFLMTKPGF